VLQIGDFVKGDNLHCGSGSYVGGVVVSLEPFQMVSSSGDMYWSTSVKAEDMDFAFRASHEMVNHCMRWVPAERQLRFDVGDSLGSIELMCGLTLVAVDAKPELCLAVDLVLDSNTYGWSFCRVSAAARSETQAAMPAHWKTDSQLSPDMVEKFVSVVRQKKVLHFSTSLLMKSFHG
jgi:hypothetical protein